MITTPDSRIDISRLLRAKKAMMESKLAVPLSHPTSKGDQSELAWIDFLKSFLPHRYAVTKGFVFDSRNNFSEQIDVIIYDRHHSPLIFESDNEERYVTAESVYAVFEVKQKINAKNLQYANRKIETVQSLTRTSKEMIASGKVVPARPLTTILGGILATESVQRHALEGALSSCERIDFGCALKSATFKTTRIGSKFDLRMSQPEESLLAFYFLLLDELSKLGTVVAIDIAAYADVSLNSFKLEGR